MATSQSFLLVLIGFVATFFSIVLATPGIGRYNYNVTYVPSKCFGSKSQGPMVAKVSDSLWDGGKSCGKSFKVTCTGETSTYVPHPCTGQSVVVKVVDHCPECSDPTIYLAEKAFSTISNLGAFVIKIDYVPIN